MIAPLGAELNIGSLCNFRCKYCFEGDEFGVHPATAVCEDDLMRYADYLSFVSKQDYIKAPLVIRIFGGEPFMQYEKLEKFVRRVKNSVMTVNIISNGALVPQLKKEILELKQLCGATELSIAVSYDFCNQDRTRQKGTGDLVKEAIRWLRANDLCRGLITVFSKETLPSIDKVFFDYVRFHRTCPGVRVNFNIDRYSTSLIDDEHLEELMSALERIARHKALYPELKELFTYNLSYGEWRGVMPADNCIHGNIFLGMAPDGELYPGYDVPYEAESTRRLLHLGHIQDDFQDIEKRRLGLIAGIPNTIKQECQECARKGIPCRVYPWRVIKNSIEEWWDLPCPDFCRVSKLLAAYL